MPLAEALIAELTREAAGTRRILAAVPDAKLGWRPHPKSTPLGELAFHVALLPRAIASLLREPVGRIPDVRLRGDAGAAELVALLDESLAAATEALTGWGDAGLRETWSLERGGKRIIEMPRAAGVRTIMLNHWYHHRGQLTVYLRLLDVPLPSLYGPTADENPFG